VSDCGLAIYILKGYLKAKKKKKKKNLWKFKYFTMQKYNLPKKKIPLKKKKPNSFKIS
jgi:hypothetical protein